MDEIEILSNDLGARTRKVQCIGFFGATKVVQLEDKVLREICFVSPDDPANTGVDEAELVARSVDRFNPR
jgi:hypothetical protein